MKDRGFTDAKIKEEVKWLSWLENGITSWIEGMVHHDFSIDRERSSEIANHLRDALDYIINHVLGSRRGRTRKNYDYIYRILEIVERNPQLNLLLGSVSMNFMNKFMALQNHPQLSSLGKIIGKAAENVINSPSQQAKLTDQLKLRIAATCIKQHDTDCYESGINVAKSIELTNGSAIQLMKDFYSNTMRTINDNVLLRHVNSALSFYNNHLWQQKTPETHSLFIQDCLWRKLGYYVRSNKISGIKYIRQLQKLITQLEEYNVDFHFDESCSIKMRTSLEEIYQPCVKLFGEILSYTDGDKKLTQKIKKIINKINSESGQFREAEYFDRDCKNIINAIPTAPEFILEIRKTLLRKSKSVGFHQGMKILLLLFGINNMYGKKDESAFVRNLFTAKRSQPAADLHVEIDAQRLLRKSESEFSNLTPNRRNLILSLVFRYIDKISILKLRNFELNKETSNLQISKSQNLKVLDLFGITPVSRFGDLLIKFCQKAPKLEEVIVDADSSYRPQRLSRTINYISGLAALKKLHFNVLIHDTREGAKNSGGLREMITLMEENKSLIDLALNFYAINDAESELIAVKMRERLAPNIKISDMRGISVPAIIAAELREAHVRFAGQICIIFAQIRLKQFITSDCKDYRIDLNVFNIILPFLIQDYLTCFPKDVDIKTFSKGYFDSVTKIYKKKYGSLETDMTFRKTQQLISMKFFAHKDNTDTQGKMIKDLKAILKKHKPDGGPGPSESEAAGDGVEAKSKQPKLSSLTSSLSKN